MMLLGLPYFFFLIYAVVSITRSWIRSAKEKYLADPSSAMLTIAGVIFTILAPLIGFCRYDDFGRDIPFSKPHVLIIEVMVVVSAVCYWVSRFYKREIPKALNHIVRAGLLQGIVLDCVVMIHFGPFLMSGLAFPEIGFELLAPVIAILLIAYELRCNFAITPQSDSLTKIIPGILMVALILVEQGLLLPFGLSWSSWWLAFTQSHGFVFSQSLNYLNAF
jgi:hypothetical protein